ncbi:hypothetical protein [Psychrobacter pygoscelis]|uniref:hypothetical protein n=1 Tax=Psychrobacter pygoscelis TaxID=2488563 RepID=UPI0013F4006A|nr:hypothetical protein [Psychrobacter pygoscelis]
MTVDNSVKVVSLLFLNIRKSIDSIMEIVVSLGVASLVASVFLVFFTDVGTTEQESRQGEVSRYGCKLDGYKK